MNLSKDDAPNKNTSSKHSSLFPSPSKAASTIKKVKPFDPDEYKNGNYQEGVYDEDKVEVSSPESRRSPKRVRVQEQSTSVKRTLFVSKGSKPITKGTKTLNLKKKEN